jgi:hypothetical protein
VAGNQGTYRVDGPYDMQRSCLPPYAIPPPLARCRAHVIFSLISSIQHLPSFIELITSNHPGLASAPDINQRLGLLPVEPLPKEILPFSDPRKPRTPIAAKQEGIDVSGREPRGGGAEDRLRVQGGAHRRLRRRQVAAARSVRAQRVQPRL